MKSLTKEDIVEKMKKRKTYSGQASFVINLIVDNNEYDIENFSKEIYESEPDYSQEFLKKKDDGTRFYHIELDKIMGVCFVFVDDDGNPMPANTIKWVENYNKKCEVKQIRACCKVPNGAVMNENGDFVIDEAFIGEVVNVFDKYAKVFGNVYKFEF